MSYLLCIDLGTSICKSVVYDFEFHEVSRAYRDIATIYPRLRWAEQSPEEWWKATVDTVKETMDKGGIDPQDLAGVAVCGQSHGPVLLDGNGNALLPCIIWPDLRAIKQSESIETHIGRKTYAYYTAPKLLWIKENLPEVFNEMHKFVLPKDYIRLKLTGRILTDVGDAMGTLMYDRGKGSWDYPLLDFIGLSHDKLPEVSEPDQVIGGVTAEGASETRLREGTPVIAGTGDAHSISLGLGDTIKPGGVAVYLGSAPAIFTPVKDRRFGGFMGPGGQSVRWFWGLSSPKDSEVPFEVLDMEAEEVEPGSEGILFLPHLMGERGPSHDPHAKGVVFGLNLHHRRGHVIRAMMEGVAFQLRLILDGIRRSGTMDEISEILAIGGGAKSPVWRQIIADVFNAPVCLPDREETSTLGLAILLSVGLGICKDICESSNKVGLRVIERVEPRETYHRQYEKMFSLYVKLENALSEFFGTV